MQIKILKYKPVTYSPKIVAEVVIKLEDVGLVIHGIKVIQGEKGTFYGLPSQTQWDPETRSNVMENGKKKYFPICEFDSKFDSAEFAAKMDEALASYNDASQPTVAAASPQAAAASQFDDLPF